MIWEKNEILLVESEAKVLNLCYGMISVWTHVAHN